MPSTTAAAATTIAAVLTALTTLDADAQSYRCSSGGTVYYSDRPCAVGPAPRPTPPLSTPPLQAPPRAPEHQKYMSAECASIQDGIRTAPSRGVGYQMQADLQWDYNRKCPADERQARYRQAQDEQREEQQRQQQQVQAAEAASRDEAQARRASAQCGEMRRIVANRQERVASMTAGQRADFERFRNNFAARCPQPARPAVD